METNDNRLLRVAAEAAHDAYTHGGLINSNDLEIANYDEAQSFVEGVDQGFWVEARVWVPDESVLERLLANTPED